MENKVEMVRVENEITIKVMTVFELPSNNIDINCKEVNELMIEDVKERLGISNIPESDEFIHTSYRIESSIKYGDGLSETLVDECSKDREGN